MNGRNTRVKRNKLLYYKINPKAGGDHESHIARFINVIAKLLPYDIKQKTASIEEMIDQ